FERSLERAIEGGYWHRHPYFDEYVTCALADAGFIPKVIRQRLIDEFEERPGVIPPGYTDWPSQVVREVRRANGDAAAGGNRIRDAILQKIAADATNPAA